MPAASAIRAHLTTDEATARRIAMLVGEILPDETAASAFEASDGGWQVDIFMADDTSLATVRDLVAVGGGDGDALVVTEVKERDWVKASLEGLTPVRAGRIVVHGAHDRDGVPVNALGVEVEAALAFGTGHHGTTHGCLLALAEVSKRLRPRRILDVGTGTGVLAMAAAKLYRRPVIATDIDAVAVTSAGNNARHNAVGPWVTLIHAAGCDAAAIRSRGPYDLILANILLGPLCGMSTDLVALAAPGGIVVLSGLLPAHARPAAATYRARGLTLLRRIPRDGWMTLVMRKPR